MDETNRWILLIKEIRAKHNIGILDAERIALTDPKWRRWVNHQINTNMQCQRMALHHMRANGESALIERDGDALKVRETEV